MGNVHRPHTPQPGPDTTGGGVLVLGGAVLGFVSLGIAFEASLWAGGVLLLGAGVALFFAALSSAEAQAPRQPAMLFVAAAVWALAGGLIVFDWHWLAFTPAAWVFNALFVAALAAGAWKSLKAWAKLLAGLTAAALVTATVVLPRPPGGEGALDTVEKWKVDVRVSDEADGAPLQGARVLCATLMPWNRALGADDAAARTTREDGSVETWEFEEDLRLKIAVCTAWKNADDGNAGYPPETLIVPAPAGGGEYQLQFALNENAHPDTAFLTIMLTGDYANQSWFTLLFEVWAGTPQGYPGDRAGPQPLMRKAWGELKGGLQLPADAAAGDLTLRYHYEGPGGEGLVPPYNEVRELTLGPIAAGTRRRVTLRMPSKGE